MKASNHQENNLYRNIFNAIDFEKIVDHPNILIAAHFWDTERYRAAKNCYKFMRAIDDLIDNYKTEHITIAQEDKAKFESDVYHWINTIIDSADNLPSHRELIETIHQFSIPFWPLEAFAKSMIYDIYHDGFPTLQSFIDYAAGASVAPASIFVHLCGLTQKDGKYIPPAFDVKEVATPCAIFSYLVHIIRDFQKDHLNHLNYFPDDLIAKYGIDHQQLLFMAKGGQISEGFRKLIRELYNLADQYRLKTYKMILEVNPYLEARSRLSLEIIFELYLMVFERIDPENGIFTSEALNPTPEEIKERVWTVIERFDSI